jgi:hypothetical protein
MKNLLLRTLPTALFFCTLVLPAQTPPSPHTASAILNPSLSDLQRALDGIRVDKWKTSNSVRDETDANIASIRRDVEATLPPLLATADAAPDSVPQILPAFRNIEALYDVLLRISSAARLAAPAPQAAALDQAITSLDNSRRALGDQLQTAAIAQERKVRDLQASLRAMPPAAPTPAPCPPPPAPAKKHKTHPKPKPAAPSSTPPQPTPPVTQ